MGVFRIIVLVFVFSIPVITTAQIAPPGCYCKESSLFTVSSTDIISTIGLGLRYSPQPCSTAFGQEDGTNCVVCLCTDEFNDAGIFQIQQKKIFKMVATNTYDFVSCSDVINPNETELFCGPCGDGQLSNSCETFVTPDTGSPTDPVISTIPTMGEWSLIILCTLLLIFSIVAIKSTFYSTRTV